MAKECGLECVLFKPFHEFFYDNAHGEGLDLLQRMRVLNDRGTISQDEWEASGILKLIRDIFSLLFPEKINIT